ncbi:MAG: DUF2945 domain-containing protein [Microcoleaceae cyanobacterium]
MSQEFKKGDKVEWSAGEGTTTGKVQKRITEPTEVEGNRVVASKEDPRYLVENDNTGKVTGHKPETLTKAQDSKSSNQSSKQSSNQSSSNDGSSSNADAFSPGDKVEWNTSQGKTTGKIKKKLTEEIEIGDQKIKATEDDPRYLVESEKTGKEAAHKPSALTRID